MTMMRKADEFPLKVAGTVPWTTAFSYLEGKTSLAECGKKNKLELINITKGTYVWVIAAFNKAGPSVETGPSRVDFFVGYILMSGVKRGNKVSTCKPPGELLTAHLIRNKGL